MVILLRTLNEDYKPVTNKADYKPIPALKKRLSQISTAHILFSTGQPLIDIDPHPLLLVKEPGKSAAERILKNKLQQ